MAQSISLWGAQYSDVPSVELPKTGGGTALFADPSPTTAVASDVAASKYFLNAQGELTLGTGTGGGGGGAVVQDQDGYLVLDDEPGTSVTVEALSVTQNGTYTATAGHAYSPVTVNVSGGETPAPDAVRFIDYDGTILHTYSASEFLALTAMPANPTHTGLTAQGWNWTLAQIKAQLTAVPDGEVWVGQVYITTSGDTEIDVYMASGLLSPTLTLYVNGAVQVDWGDGSSANSVTGTSLTASPISVDHVYATSGDYTISIHVVSGEFKFYGAGSAYLLAPSGSSRGYAFANCVKDVRFGSGVSKLPSYLFYWCRSLKTVTLPNNITGFDSGGIFNYCYSLVSVTFPAGIAYFYSLFSSAYNLINVSIPYAITSGIPSYMYNSCYSLKGATIPSAVTSIGSYAFSGCYSLANIALPSGVTSIESNAFNYCISLSEIDIPNTVTSIGSNAFQYCYSLTSVVIPNGVSSIDASTFRYCYSLRNVSLPSNISSIGNYAFGDCKSLESISLPNTITSLGIDAFQNCSALSIANIPTGITSVPNYTFSYCYPLTSITIPTGITSIGNYALQGCGFSTITVPNTVTSIGTSAFNGCKCATTITVGSGVTSILGGAFNGCESMKDYHFLSTTPPTLGGTNVFTGIPSDCKIYVPSASLTAYQTATNWSTYASYMVGE